MPLHFESRVSGLICLVSHTPGRFDDDDLRLLQILSDQAAVAIENARLLHRRDELVEELAGLLEISEAAGAAEDEQALAALLAARLRQATHSDTAVVTRWDEGSTRMHVIWRDGARGRCRDHRRRRLGRSAGGPARRESGPRRDRSRQGACGGSRAGTHRRTRMLLLPLTVAGRTIGMLELVSLHELRMPTPAEMNGYEAMAGLAAAGMEKARALEQLRSAADMDLVTGVHNHRHLQERLRQEAARSARSHRPSRC